MAGVGEQPWNLLAGKAILRARKEKLRMTAVAFADRLGIGADTVSAYENGKVTVPAKYLLQAAEMAGCTVDEIVFPERLSQLQTMAETLAEHERRIRELENSMP